MKYIEELNAGQAFTKDNQVFLLTIDFKNNGQRLGYSIDGGVPRWFNANDTVEDHPLYLIDENNNVIPVKTIYNTPTNISQISPVAH